MVHVSLCPRTKNIKYHIRKKTQINITKKEKSSLTTVINGKNEMSGRTNNNERMDRGQRNKLMNIKNVVDITIYYTKFYMNIS